MLTDSEVQYVEEFLQGLPIHSVLSVAHTVSKGMLEPENKAAAVKIIVQHSENAESILTRKFISKQYLFSYLHWRNISVSQSSNKNALVQKILTLWEETPFQSKAPMPQNYMAPSDQNGAAPSVFQSQSSNLRFGNGQQGGDTNSTSTSINSNSPYYQNSAPMSYSDGGGSQCTFSDNSCNSYGSDLAASISLSNGSSVSNEYTLVPSNQNVVSNTTNVTSSFNADELAVRFAEWFYNLINKMEYISNDSSENYLGPQHFWQDASVKINLTNNSEMTSHEATGSSEATELLLNIKTQHTLFFNPNLSQDGVRGKSEPHGMAVIVACGSLHKGVGQFVGVFEQIFYLLRDPLCSNNWKVKHSTLILRSQSINALDPPPTLNNSELAHSLQLPALT